MSTPTTIRRAIKLERFGDPSVLQLLEEPIAPPAPGQMQLRQVAIGFNYIDIYQRSRVSLTPLTI